jgi:hypothetical protein
MAKPVDLNALGPGIRRLAERGAREAFGMSLDRLLDDFAISGTEFDAQDLETLVLAGTLAEKAHRIDAGRIVHVTLKGETLTSASRPTVGSTAQPVDLAALDPETRRLADRGAEELLGFSLDRLVDNLKAARETFDQRDLDTFVLAGRMGEEADRREARSSE